MRALTLPTAAALTLGAFATWPSHAAVLLSENFDELTPQLGATAVGALHTIDGTNVDIVGGALFGSLCAPPESGNCVDMDGTGGNPVGVLQSNSSITLNPGTTYLLSFDLVGSQRGPTDSVTVTFGPYDKTFVLASNDNSSGIVSNAMITVTAPTSSFLTFQSNDPPGSVEGELLDDVLITSQSTAVPEPASRSLLAGALLGLGLIRRRRNRM
jgi:hypothetical protein